MKSTQIHRTVVGDRVVDTSFVEGHDYGYYETAICKANGSYSIEEWGMQLPSEAEAFHFTIVWLLRQGMK